MTDKQLADLEVEGLEVKGIQYGLHMPTAHELLLMNDWFNSEETPNLYKTETFVSFFVIYLCLRNDDQELYEVMNFKTFLRSVDIEDLKRLNTRTEKFRARIEDIETSNDPENDNGIDKDDSK